MPPSTSEDPRKAPDLQGYKEPQNQPHPGSEKDMNIKPDFGYDTYKGSGKLNGKVALITGADSGIGRAVALAYAREGADVAICYLNEHEDAKETQKVVEEAGRKAILVAGDLAEEATCSEYVDATVEAFGRIDILVNNASYQGFAVDDFTELTRDRLEATFKTNIIAMIQLAQKAVKHMAPGSAIINSASIQAYGPSQQIMDYACTKGAIVTFTKALSTELLPKTGIRVNAVAPGPVWTPLIPQSFPADMIKSFGESAAGVPAARPGHPRELAPAYVFLACNDDSSYISGEILGVTGGGLLA